MIRSLSGFFHAILHLLCLNVMPVLEGCLPLFFIFPFLLTLQLFLPAFGLSYLFCLGLQGSNRLQAQKQNEINPDQEQFIYLCPVLNHAMHKHYSITKLGLFFGILATTICFTACVKDNKDVVPYAHIDLFLDLSSDLSLLGPGLTATVIPIENGIGSIIDFGDPKYPKIPLGPGQILQGNGIIIYHNPIDIYTYEVYDITCTFKAQTDYCRLDRHPDIDGIFVCPCCDSKFLVLQNGDVFEGPAALGLKRYPAYVQNNALVIRN